MSSNAHSNVLRSEFTTVIFSKIEKFTTIDFPKKKKKKRKKHTANPPRPNARRDPPATPNPIAAGHLNGRVQKSQRIAERVRSRLNCEIRIGGGSFHHCRAGEFDRAFGRPRLFNHPSGISGIVEIPLGRGENPGAFTRSDSPAPLGLEMGIFLMRWDETAFVCVNRHNSFNFSPGKFERIVTHKM
jgi:hypothetical protein